MVIALVMVALSGAYWLMNAVLCARAIQKVPRLADVPLEESRTWPTLSVVIPACNEGKTLEAALRAKLADDYPALEVVLVDDRSTDDTGAIADRLAAEDSRVTVIHVKELPKGWLGKLHAMHVGAKAARGEWLLFSDADVHFAKGTLRRAITQAERRGAEHLSAIPQIWPGGFLLDATLSFFVRLVCVAARVGAVEDPKSKAAFGAGAFNLVKRSALERSPGFEHLRLEVGDDAALAQMLKKAGAKTTLVNGVGTIGLEFYESLADMTRGTEKNGYAVMGHYSLTRVIAGCVALLVAELGIFAGLATGSDALRFVSAAFVALSLVISVVVNRWAGRRSAPALFSSMGVVLLVFMMLRSGWLGFRRGGIVWRGTLYRSEELREGIRLDALP